MKANLAGQLLLAEYNSLRSECLASIANAANAMRWLVAIYGALFAAGMLAVETYFGGDSTLSPQEAEVLSNIILLLFGFGLPGTAWGSSWNWLGELKRGQRAGAYLREIERDIFVSGEFLVAGRCPIQWETFIRGESNAENANGRLRMSPKAGRKTNLPYMPIAAVFFVASWVSFGIMCYWWSTQLNSVWWIIVAAVFNAVGAIVFLVNAFSVRWLGIHGFGITNADT